jgi:hypothetical protein
MPGRLAAKPHGCTLHTQIAPASKVPQAPKRRTQHEYCRSARSFGMFSPVSCAAYLARAGSMDQIRRAIALLRRCETRNGAMRFAYCALRSLVRAAGIVCLAVSRVCPTGRIAC